MSLPSTITSLGFTRAEDFQRAWNLGPRLKVDGLVGPLTTSAAALSFARHARGQGDLSAHFSAAEFACHCGGALPGCHGVLVLRDLLQSLESLRGHVDAPLRIVSGYRCPKYNASIAAAAGDSQHQYGAAADIASTTPGALGHPSVTGLHLFAGVGWSAATGIVEHVDRRDVSASNTTHSTVSHPATWTYPR